nr:RNA-dependent RNA polymerase 6-like [Tanacetum cinerariifolium]
MRALYSSHIACFQLGLREAWKGDLGIKEEVVTRKLYLGLAFTILTLERVTIGCCEVAGGGGGVVGGVGVICGDGVDSGVGGVDCGFVFGLFMVVKASISIMIVKILEKDRWCGMRGKFVWWKGVRVSKASKPLGVEDDIFWDMQMKNVMNLNQMFVDNDVAYDEITTSYTESENTSFIMLGAVNMPGLEHLVDHLIFPQKGERPHTDEASRSDLDGDLYFDTWDDHLILPNKQSWLPMEYTTAEAKELPRELVTRFHDLLEITALHDIRVHAIETYGDNKYLGNRYNTTTRTSNFFHYGDIQVLKAVNMSDLEHLVDRLIFPQKGERPYTDEALGSDLDDFLNVVLKNLRFYNLFLNFNLMLCVTLGGTIATFYLTLTSGFAKCGAILSGTIAILLPSPEKSRLFSSVAFLFSAAGSLTNSLDTRNHLKILTTFLSGQPGRPYLCINKLAPSVGPNTR